MRYFLSIASVLLLFLGGCQPQSAARTDTVTVPVAMQYSTEDLLSISKDAQAVADKTMQKAPASGRRAKRLMRLTAKFGSVDGQSLDYGVYMSKIVAASALPSGSIRISSALMDMMTDNELFFILAHQIGHMQAGHSLVSLNKVCVAAGYKPDTHKTDTPKIRALFDAFVGDVLTQNQEYAADEYAYQFMVKHGYDLKAGVSALRKLAKLRVNAGFSVSHPGSDERAQKMLGTISKQ